MNEIRIRLLKINVLFQKELHNIILVFEKNMKCAAIAPIKRMYFLYYSVLFK